MYMLYRFVGVGLEELGVEEFVAGKYFDGGKFIINVYSKRLS